MTDTAPTPAAGAPPSPAGDPAPTPSPAGDNPAAETPEPFDEDRARAKIRESNREAKALRERLKAAEDQLTKLNEAGQSDLEKATGKATKAETRVAELEAELLRRDVADAKGLTAAQAKRLVGATKEELEADADELLATFAPPQSAGAPVAPAATPTRAPVAGTSDPTTEAVELDPAKLAEQVPRGGLF